MRSIRRAALAGLLVAGAALALGPAAVATPVATSAARAGTGIAATAALAPPAASVPRPVFWFPFHTPVRLGCVVDNCGRGMNGGHHYWAIDFFGPIGTPVYAAATGIAHVGGRGGCVAASAPFQAKRGNWVWIDHGRGRITQYKHLAKITIRNGQRVTVATQIGTMGRGGTMPCASIYTHFEYLVGAHPGSYSGIRTNPGPMRGCMGAVRVSLPGVLNKGIGDWNRISGESGHQTTISNTGIHC